MSKTWIWSDTHFRHARILNMGNRPFTTVEEMDQSMIQAWSETVGPEDVLWHLGDFALYRNGEYVKWLLARLPGVKKLIRGNHDRDKSIKWWVDHGFDQAFEGPVSFRDDGYILSHEPFYNDDLVGQNLVNIHGHTHHNQIGDGHHLNVSVEAIGYKPVDLDELVANWKKEKS